MVYRVYGTKGVWVTPFPSQQPYWSMSPIPHIVPIGDMGWDGVYRIDLYHEYHTYRVDILLPFRVEGLGFP